MSTEHDGGISPVQAVYFRNKIRAARDATLRDSEGYQQVLFAVEQMGQQLWGKDANGKLTKNTLSRLRCDFVRFVNQFDSFPGRPEWGVCFGERYDMVKKGRDDAMHVGAVARSLTGSCVKLAITLEDALMRNIDEPRISDYMVSNPVCTYGWQRIALIRQTMLESSFSYLPFRKDDRKWYMVSADAICRYLRSADNEDQRKYRLARTLCEAEDDKECRLTTTIARRACPDEKMQCVLGKIVGDEPVLVTRREKNGEVEKEEELVGILNAFDLM